MKFFLTATVLMVTLMVGGCNTVSRTSPYYQGISDEEYNRRMATTDSVKKLSAKFKIMRDAWHAHYPNETIQYSYFAYEVVLAEKYEAGSLTKAQYMAESAASLRKTDILQSDKDAQREMLEINREVARNSNKTIFCSNYGSTTICN